jgi:hypothetical protein
VPTSVCTAGLYLHPRITGNPRIASAPQRRKHFEMVAQSNHAEIASLLSASRAETILFGIVYPGGEGPQGIRMTDRVRSTVPASHPYAFRIWDSSVSEREVVEKERVRREERVSHPPIRRDSEMGQIHIRHEDGQFTDTLHQKAARASGACAGSPLPSIINWLRGSDLN